MRPIDEARRRKFLSHNQTKAAGADPAAVVWITRPTVPLTDAEFLDRATVTEASGLTACDVAVRRLRAGREADRIYLAYIDENGAHVKFAATAAKMSDHVWTDAPFAASADDVAICFDGTMPKAVGESVQLVTETEPWVFWTASGALYAQKLGLLGVTQLATSNCTRVTAVRAAWAGDSSVDFGLVVFFLLSGAIYYRQLIGGTWTDAAPVRFGPSGVTWADIAAFRTLDFRVGLQGITTDGDVYELFSQFQGFARRGTEHISLSAAARGALTAIRHLNAQNVENVSLDLAAAPGPYGGLYRTGTPSLLRAENADDGGGDFGRIVLLTFDRHMRADEVAAQRTAFRLTDGLGRVFVPQAAAVLSDGYTVRLTFLDFNSAAGSVTASYIPGTVHTMADAALPALSLAFAPVGLVPPGVPAPAPVSVSNAGPTSVTVVFDSDAALEDISAAAQCFTVRISRADYSPGGTLRPVDLPVISAVLDSACALRLTLGSGNLSNLETAVGDAAVIYDGAATLYGAGGPVSPFTLSFTPAGVDYKPDPMDAEHIELSLSAAGRLTRIYHAAGYQTEHIALAFSASGQLTHVDDL